MRNIIQQETFGSCADIVVANILNNKKIVTDKKDFSNGNNWIDTQRLLEKYSDYTCKGIFEVRKPFKGVCPVFEIDEVLEENRDHYVLFISSLFIDEKAGHAILIIKENHNQTLTILDPLKEESYTVHQNNFFATHNCVGIQMICSKDGSEMFFFESFIEHLNN